jgi:hypothetical protein
VLTPDGTPVKNPDRTCFSVTSASGATYQVDLASGSCNCDDAEYRGPAGGCKHGRRARLVTSREAVPAAVDADDQLGEHVATPATDGGVVPAAERDHAEIVDDGDVWDGSHTEFDKYGQPTGVDYVRCRACGVKALAAPNRLIAWGSGREAAASGPSRRRQVESSPSPATCRQKRCQTAIPTPVTGPA